MPATEPVPALVPLSLLEAMRNLDTPLDDGLAEASPDILNKRLGLSPTVAAQIQRYAALARTGASIPREEAVSVWRLVGRRPDAALLFADAGRRAARHAVAIAPALWRTGATMLPGPLRRRLGRPLAARLARETFGATVLYRGVEVQVRLAGSVGLEALPDGAGCGFYGACFAELARKLTGFEGAMLPEACQGKGGVACEWRGVPPAEL